MFCRSVIVEDQHLEREVDDSVCELEISEVMEGGKAEKQFVRWQSSDFEEEESSSSSEDDDKGMRQLYMQKMRQAEALKESSTDLSMCDQHLKAPEKGPSSLSIKLVVENRNADQLAMKDLSTGPLNKSVEEEVPVKDRICKWWTSGKRPAQVEEAGCKKLFGAGPVDDSDQLHCSQMGPHLGTRVPMGTFLGIWVPIGSPFYVLGPLFPLF